MMMGVQNKSSNSRSGTSRSPYHDNDEEHWPEERGENENDGGYGSSSSSYSMTRRKRMAIMIVVVLSIVIIALATAVALTVTGGGGGDNGESSSSSSSGSDIQSTSPSKQDDGGTTTGTVSNNINNDEGGDSNDSTNDNQQQIQPTSPSPTTIDLSTSPPTTVKPTAAPSFPPTTATPTVASPSHSPTVVDINNSTDTGTQLPQTGNNDSDTCTPFECIDLGIGRYGHFQWIKRGQALCNDVHRFGLTMSGELVKSSFNATTIPGSSCDDGSESSSSSRVVLHQDLTAEAFQMTDQGHFVLVKDLETDGIGTVVWEAVPNIDIEPSPGFCISNPPLQCPYLHLRRSSDIVLNSINSIDGSWSDRKVSKIFPDLFP